ncbi:hypothetical protein [Klebsiella quasivariicola]|uniref:Uncharacterized protein n=1 Tax=Klebsiella quasivariicola TaxID=2026240 RepID=A0A8B4TNE9_9ENTR|nr:hypothetical protein [Klebsiella quasivariicola]SXD86834.1 Uncharacterised protein [Klebsiella quasivariicola]
MKTEHLIDYLVSENIDLVKLRGKDGLVRYKEQLTLLYCSDLLTVNALSKVSWHTAATIKKTLEI